MSAFPSMFCGDFTGDNLTDCVSFYGEAYLCENSPAQNCKLEGEFWFNNGTATRPLLHQQPIPAADAAVYGGGVFQAIPDWPDPFDSNNKHTNHDVATVGCAMDFDNDGLMDIIKVEKFQPSVGTPCAVGAALQKRREPVFSAWRNVRRQKQSPDGAFINFTRLAGAEDPFAAFVSSAAFNEVPFAAAVPPGGVKPCEAWSRNWHPGPPSCQDFNGDGLIDIILPTQNTLSYFVNMGTLSQPNFTYSTDLNPMRNPDANSVGQRASITCLDLDQDGLVDCLVGLERGAVAYFHNQGTKTKPAMFPIIGSGNPLNGIDPLGITVPPASIPALTTSAWCGDMNSDGMADCVIRSGYGRGYAYFSGVSWPSRTVANPFKEQWGGKNPFEGTVRVSRYTRTVPPPLLFIIFSRDPEF